MRRRGTRLATTPASGAQQGQGWWSSEGAKPVPLAFASLTEENASAARDLLLAWWAQGWTDAFAQDFFDWRYRARPTGDTRLVLDAGRCVAILDSFIRPYLLNGRRTTVRETCDWFCLPEYRPLGIGVKLMRDLMKRPEPIISVGGLESTLVLLPRLRWERLPDVHDFVLPISARTLAANILRHFASKISGAAQMFPTFLELRRVRMSSAPSARTDIRPWKPDPTRPTPPARAYGLGSLVTDDNIHWLASAPDGLGSFIGLSFFVDGAPVGVSVSRIENCESGRYAKILHVEVAKISQPVIRWIVSETANHLVAGGAGIVRCLSSCPQLGEALRRTGFIRFRRRPTYWWTNDAEIPVGPLHLTYNRADDALPMKPRPAS